MKSQLIAIVAAVLVVGCGESQPPEPPDISIHKAVIDGNIEAVKKHLADGVDVNAKNDSENTPLHRAALKGHKEVVELLIQNGADVNARSHNYLTPLNFAYFKRSPSKEYAPIIDLLIKHGGKTYLELQEEELADLLRKNGAK
jgi:ankyrin repeat protein